MASILIVDDNHDTCDGLSRYINLLGLEATCVYSGAEALEFLETNAVDLVIIDFMMPEMDGLSLLDELHRSSKAHTFRTVIYTAALNRDLQQRAALLGVSDYWLKSQVDFETIEAKLREWFPENFGGSPFDRIAV